ncbi:hypothetical protein NLX83_15105 [Allokutzneria sp. A3M-2-11 16]|uniref:hypothetical protein n=1 Tax=Allokutzneria sp. A3M-2-11 16 TaxID=2962043 RepID=UPI0020B733B1|nr:hypothetical protein [Allokutzneria sp. A3M-2-11 16]MCP3800593.1 hypothetical protein [Allokutzneria sp. A3M-2-11 16]
MRNRLRGAAVLATAVVFTGFGSASAAAPGWTVTPTPKLTPGYVLNGGSMVNANSGWAVGYHLTNMWAGTVALRWDGKGWKHTPTPKGLTLSAVAATGERNALAVGLKSEKASLAARWDGAKWVELPSPTPGGLPAGADPELSSIAVVSENDAWAAGCAQTDDFSAGVPLLNRWNGKAWSAVAVPKPANANFACLRGVAARGANEAWAVGYAGTGAGVRPLALRWDGAKWTEVAAAATGAPEAKFTQVVISGKDVWAVGFVDPEGGNPLALAPHVQRWDGAKWSVVPVPAKQGLLYGAASDGKGGAYASGYTSSARPIALRWNGSAWVEEKAGLPEHAILMGVATVPGTSKVWAFGDDAGEPQQGLAAQHGG